jgi:heme exporter protein B
MLLADTGAVALKEVRLAVRGRTGAVAVLAFGALALCLLAFAFGPAAGRTVTFEAGALWITFFFAGQLALQGAFVLERENGALEGFLASGGDRLALFLGKLAAAWLVTAVVEVVAVPLYLLLFGRAGSLHVGALGLSLALGDAGFLAAGVLLSAVTAQARAGEAVFPLALFPVAVPALLAGVATTRAALGASLAAPWWQLLVGYDVLFAALALLLFEQALEVT